VVSIKMEKWKSEKILKSILYMMLGIFILLMSYFILFPLFIDDVGRSFFLFIAILGLIFLLFGVTLIYLTIKQGIKGKLRIFLLLTGVSAISPLVFSVLHNVFYALGIISKNILIIKYTMEVLHVVSFLIAIPISPIVFLVGIIGSLILLKKLKGCEK